jgi:hypothetical protein
MLSIIGIILVPFLVLAAVVSVVLWMAGFCFTNQRLRTAQRNTMYLDTKSISNAITDGIDTYNRQYWKHPRQR